MAIGAMIADVLSNLDSGDEALLEQVLPDVRYLLEQQDRLGKLQAATPRGSASDTRRQRAQLHEVFSEMLPEQFVGLALSSEEVDALTRALLRLLDGPAPVVGAAAWTL